MEHFDATAIILAGGKCKRMGQEKSLLEFRGKPFIAHLVEALEPQFREVIISANDPAPYAEYDVPVIADKVKDAGPLAGLAATLEVSQHELNFVLACDSPIVVFQVVKRLLSDLDGFDCAVVMGDEGQLEPLFAVYRKSLLPRVEAQLQSPKHSMHSFLSNCRIKAVSVRKGTLLNINTPEEYEYFLKTRA